MNKELTPIVPARRRTVRVIRTLVGCLASCVVIVLGATVLLLWSCEPPSLATLARRFPRERHDLEAIVAMSDTDRQLIRIDPEWLATLQHQYLTYSPETGITQARWNEYRWLFARNGITQGILRDAVSRDAFIIVASVGIVNRGHSNGFVHCGPGPYH